MSAVLLQSLETLAIIPFDEEGMLASADDVVDMAIPKGVRMTELLTARELMSTVPFELVD